MTMTATTNFWVDEGEDGWMDGWLNPMAPSIYSGWLTDSQPDWRTGGDVIDRMFINKNWTKKSTHKTQKLYFVHLCQNVCVCVLQMLECVLGIRCDDIFIDSLLACKFFFFVLFVWMCVCKHLAKRYLFTECTVITLTLLRTRVAISLQNANALWSFLGLKELHKRITRFR